LVHRYNTDADMDRPLAALERMLPARSVAATGRA